MRTACAAGAGLLLLATLAGCGSGSSVSANLRGIERALGPGDPRSSRARVVVLASDAAIGAPDAAVTVVVFGDYQCPHSRRLASALAELAPRFGADLRVVYKQLPLAYHPQAPRAAEAALAARAQGKFAALHERLLAETRRLDDAVLDELAGEAGLDLARFRRDLRWHAHARQVESDAAYARQLGVTATPTVLVNGRPLPGAPADETLAAVIAAELDEVRPLATRLAPGTDVYSTLMRDANPNGMAGLPEAIVVPTEGSPSRGPAAAPITLVVFSDFHCPHARAAAGTLAALERQLDGKLRLVWKARPRQGDEVGWLAAEAAMAAAAHGRFWAMHDALFAAPALDRESIRRAAVTAGLDLAWFDQALATGVFRGAVERDLALAARLDVPGTPTFVINGRAIYGSVGVERLRAVCDDLLRKLDDLHAVAGL